MRLFKLILFLTFIILPLFLRAETEFRFQDGSPEWHSFVERKINEIDSPSFINNADSLYRILINFGFPNAQVATNDVDGKTVIDIKFGGRFYIGDLIIEGDTNDTIVYNNHFIQTEYENLIDSILMIYKDRGYYFVNLLSPSYIADNNKIDIHLYLQTGPVVTVSAVEFTGIKKTDPKLLERYLDISIGDTLNTTQLEEARIRLMDVGFVSSIAPAEIIPEPGYNKARVSFNLSETKLLKIEGAGGYIPDNNGNFVGYLDFKLQNYFGGGRTLGLLVDKKEKNKAVQRLLYSQPLFLLGNGRAELLLATRDFREQFYEFSLNGSYNFEIGRNLKAQINLGWKNIEPNEDIIRANNVYQAGFGLKMGKMGKRFKETPQFLLSWDIGYFARFYKGGLTDSVFSQSDVNDTRNRLKIETTINLLVSTLLYLKAGFMDVNSSEQPLPNSEKFLFGGLSGLRGYRNDQFSARRLLILEVEPRLYFSAENYFYPFADAAFYEYYHRDENSQLSKIDDFIWGYGFGFNLNADNRSFDITLSWGEGEGEGDGSPFDQPRLNIVLSNSF